MVDLIDDTDSNVSAPCRPFRSTTRYDKYFNANAAELNRDADAMADIRLKYPYPPANCDAATTILQNIEDDIKVANEKLASGVSNKPVKRYADALLTVEGEFKAWLNAKQCVAVALKQEDDAFNQQLQTALNQEQTSQDNASGKSNWIIFGALGLLLLGAVAIILKRPKK